MATNLFRKIGIFAVAFIFILTLISAAEACATELDCPGKGGPWPVDVASYITYDCINSACIASDPVQVECLSNSACPIGYECDVVEAKCVLKEATALAASEVCEPCPTCKEVDYTLPIIIIGALIAFAIVFCFSNFYLKRR